MRLPGLLIAIAALGLLPPGRAVGAPADERILVVQEHGTAPTLLTGLAPYLARHGFGPERLRIDRAEVDSAVPTAKPALRALLAAGSPPRLVLTTNMGLAQLVRKVDADIPIVFAGSADPVQLCLAQTLTHPGRRATGQTNYLPAMAKMIEVLRDAYPRLERWVVLVDGTKVAEEYDPDDAPCNAGNPGGVAPPRPAPPGHCVPGVVVRPQDDEVDELADLLAYAKRVHVALSFHRICAASDLPGLAAYAGHPATTGIVVPFEYLFYLQRAPLVETMSRLRLPAVYARKLYAEQGGLIALSPLQSSEMRVFELVVEVLRGADAGRLPIQIGAGFEVWINLRTARRIGMPPALPALTRAEHFVE